MGVLQNLKLWENNVTFIDENGEMVTKKMPRVAPAAPWKVVGLLTLENWIFFIVGLGAWTADGYDFNAVNLVVTDLSVKFDKSLNAITLSITLTLLFRSLGAFIIGLLSDMFGRKWVMSINLWVLAVLQIGTAFCPNYGAFIGVRSLFGIAMGGIWGLAAALALENMPVDARGLFSGILQQGYSIGYLIAAVMNLAVVPKSPQGYKAIFFIGAGFTAFWAIVVMLIPESRIYRKQDLGEEAQHSMKKRTSLFLKDAKLAAVQYWKMFIYCVVLSSAFNWQSHGSQDMYVTFIKVQKGFDNYTASLLTILGQCGAVVGGAICGYYSQFFGRRLTVVAAVSFGLALIPLWTLPNDWRVLAVGVFFLQAANNGSWGVMPVLLNEYAPPQFRGVFPGTVYQVGNMVSAPAAQIQTVAATHWIKHGRPNYSQVMQIVLCIVFATVGIVTACGQERTGSHFELVSRAGAVHDGKAKEIELDEEAAMEMDGKTGSSHHENAKAVEEQ